MSKDKEPEESSAAGAPRKLTAAAREALNMLIARGMPMPIAPGDLEMLARRSSSARRARVRLACYVRPPIHASIALRVGTLPECTTRSSITTEGVAMTP